MKKLVAITTLALGLSATIAPSAIAYEKHEHPFEYVGTHMTQKKGDAHCKRVLKARSRALRHNRNTGKTEFIKVKVGAFDGTDISNAWHVWYHKNNGECVANK